MPTGRADRDQERGAATAETVMALPVLIVVTLALVWMIAFGVGQMRATDAAREAARALARGESDAMAIALAQEVDPGADVQIRRQGERIVVVVRRTASGPIGAFSALRGTTRGQAVAQVEPGAFHARP